MERRCNLWWGQSKNTVWKLSIQHRGLLCYKLLAGRFGLFIKETWVTRWLCSGASFLFLLSLLHFVSMSSYFLISSLHCLSSGPFIFTRMCNSWGAFYSNFLYLLVPDVVLSLNYIIEYGRTVKIKIFMFAELPLSKTFHVKYSQLSLT